MKLQFKHQKFQADAAKAVVDVFVGQPYLTPTYMMDRGINYQQSLTDEDDFTGWRNERIVPELSDRIILEHLQKVQRAGQIKPSERLEGHYNLTIEMETGVGKTYTYIKTMYELNKHYGWSKFIVVVPSIAIREGVYKSFQVTHEHFAEEYGKKIRFFIYNSSQLTEIDRFASDSSINVMIINAQAFNARGKDARRIYMKLDEFRSRRPIDIIAKTNPILIIDEPQSVEGKQTKERLKEFNPDPALLRHPQGGQHLQHGLPAGRNGGIQQAAGKENLCQGHYRVRKHGDGRLCLSGRHQSFQSRPNSDLGV